MFGERIRELRKTLGLNQAEFGKRLGVTKQSVCNWENENILPSIDMLRNIASMYSVSTDYLLGLKQTRTLDIAGLTHQQALHLRAVVNDLKEANE